MKWCKAQYKRELEIVDQTQTPRYISRFKHPALRPPFTQKDFHYSVHTGLPTEGTSTENLGKYNLKVHNSSLNKYNLLLEARHKANTISISQMRDRHKATQQQSPHIWEIRHLANTLTNTSTLRGISITTSTITSTQEGYSQSQIKEVYNSRWSQRPQTNSFSQNKILIDRIDMIAQLWEIKVFGNQLTKKNTWENN